MKAPVNDMSSSWVFLFVAHVPGRRVGVILDEWHRTYILGFTAIVHPLHSGMARRSDMLRPGSCTSKQRATHRPSHVLHLANTLKTNQQ